MEHSKEGLGLLHHSPIESPHVIVHSQRSQDIPRILHMINQLNLPIRPTLILTFDGIVENSTTQPSMIINNIRLVIIAVVEKGIQELGVI